MMIIWLVKFHWSSNDHQQLLVDWFAETNAFGSPMTFGSRWIGISGIHDRSLEKSTVYQMKSGGCLFQILIWSSCFPNFCWFQEPSVIQKERILQLGLPVGHSKQSSGLCVPSWLLHLPDPLKITWDEGIYHEWRRFKPCKRSNFQNSLEIECEIQWRRSSPANLRVWTLEGNDPP